MAYRGDRGGQGARRAVRRHRGSSTRLGRRADTCALRRRAGSRQAAKAHLRHAKQEDAKRNDRAADERVPGRQGRRAEDGQSDQEAAEARRQNDYGRQGHTRRGLPGHSGAAHVLRLSRQPDVRAVPRSAAHCAPRLRGIEDGPVQDNDTVPEEERGEQEADKADTARHEARAPAQLHTALGLEERHVPVQVRARCEAVRRLFARRAAEPHQAEERDRGLRHDAAVRGDDEGDRNREAGRGQRDRAAAAHPSRRHEAALQSRAIAYRQDRHKAQVRRGHRAREADKGDIRDFQAPHTEH